MRRLKILQLDCLLIGLAGWLNSAGNILQALHTGTLVCFYSRRRLSLLGSGFIQNNRFFGVSWAQTQIIWSQQARLEKQHLCILCHIQFHTSCNLYPCSSSELHWATNPASTCSSADFELRRYTWMQNAQGFAMGSAAVFTITNVA